MGNRFCEWADDDDGKPVERVDPAPPAPRPQATPLPSFLTSAPPPASYPTAPAAGRAGVMVRSNPAPRRNYIMKGSDGWDAALARLPDLVATGQVPNLNPEGYDACEAPGAPDGAVMEKWTDGARYIGGSTDRQNTERFENRVGRHGTSFGEIRSADGMTISGRR